MLYKRLDNGTHFTPLESPMFIDRSVNSKCEAFEPPEGGENGKRKDPEDDPLCTFGQTLGGEDEVVE